MSEKIKDPVCGMTVEKSSAKGPLEVQGQQVYFCSAKCLEEFKKDPKKYIHTKTEGA